MVGVCDGNSPFAISIVLVFNLFHLGISRGFDDDLNMQVAESPMVAPLSSGRGMTAGGVFGNCLSGGSKGDGVLKGLQPAPPHLLYMIFLNEWTTLSQEPTDYRVWLQLVLFDS